MATKSFVFVVRPNIKKIRILFSLLVAVTTLSVAFAQNASNSAAVGNVSSASSAAGATSATKNAASASTSKSTSHKFTQYLSWQEDKNVYEYKVEIRPVDGGGTISTGGTISGGEAISGTSGDGSLILTTSESSVKFSLPGGKYKYKIYAYDFLGRVASESSWNEFEIIKAIQPSVKASKPSYSLPKKKKKEITLDVNVEGVTEKTKIILHNTKTNEEIEGKLNVKGSGKNLTADSAVFDGSIGEGEWVLKVENPSGLVDVSAPFELAVEEVPEPKEEPAKTPEEPSPVEVAKAESKKAGIDLQFMLGAAMYYNTDSSLLFGEAQSNTDQNRVFPVPYATISLLPFKNRTHTWKLGFSVTAESQHFMEKTKHEDAYVQSEVTMDLLMANLLFHTKIIRDRLYIALSLGMGLGMVNKDVELDMSFDPSHVGEAYKYKNDFGFVTMNGGTSLFWIPVKHIAVEGGANFVYSTSSDSKELKMINPFVGMGLRF